MLEISPLFGHSIDSHLNDYPTSLPLYFLLTSTNSPIFVSYKELIDVNTCVCVCYFRICSRISQRFIFM